MYPGDIIPWLSEASSRVMFVMNQCGEESKIDEVYETSYMKHLS